MFSPKKSNKKIVYLLIYLIFFVFVPFFISIFFVASEKESLIVFLLGIYVIFVSPILFLIPYKLSKLENLREKMYFVLFGFVIPFAAVYYYLFLDFQKNFNPSF
jgi:membrane protease YdiL (CAAX protease family)